VLTSFFVLVQIALAPLFCGTGGPFAPGVPSYDAPVDSPIHRGFDLPAGQYGPGNRGLDYDTPSDRAVRTIGAGEVTFAGPVAGRVFVTIAHPDGLRSSYGPLAHAAVRAGEVVGRAQTIGRTAGRLHLGVRRGDEYLDPAPLLGGPVPIRVRLVDESRFDAEPARSRCDALGYTRSGP